MSTGHRDLRFALRQLRKRPGLGALVVVTLAAGIGVNTAIFSVVDGFLLRPLPFPAADRLVMVESTDRGVSFADYLDWRERSRVFVDLAIVDPTFVANVDFGGGTETARTVLASWNLFPLLGVQPRLGRWLLPADDLPGAGCVVLLSHGLWVKRFAADPRVLGRKVMLEDRPCSVAGVMPPSFSFPAQTEIWAPYGPTAERDQRAGRFDAVVGRLRPAVTVARAGEDMADVARALAREYPLSNQGVSARVVPLRDVSVGGLRRPLLLLLGACGFLLGITCANVASLLLTRALGREREIAVRAALGAERRHLFRQLATEHLVYAAGGGGLGLVLAWLGVAAVRGAIPVALPFWLRLGLDGRAAAFTAVISVLVALLFGLAPMLQLVRVDLAPALKAGAAPGGERSRRRLRSSLVVVEIALAVALAAGARLMVTSFLRLRLVEPGFRAAGVLVADVNLTYHPGERLPAGRYSQLMQAALARVARLPGVEAAGADGTLPLAGQYVWDREPVTLFGQSPAAQQRNPIVNWQSVSPDYFKALGIPLLSGRLFGPRDVVGQPRVALVGEEAARRLWPHQDPVGRRIKLGPPSWNSTWWTVVGVVRDVHQQSLAVRPGCDLFSPIFQAPRKVFAVVVRTRGEPSAMARAVRLALTATSPEIGVGGTRTLADVVAGSLWVPRLWGWLFGLFSVLALLLAAGGIYGVMASAVRERTREIGVRMALGAGRRQVLFLMLGAGLRLAAAGAALGAALSAVLARALAGLLFGVDAADPRVLGEVVVFLVAVALAASWLASRRGSRVDPVVALRAD